MHPLQNDIANSRYPSLSGIKRACSEISVRDRRRQQTLETVVMFSRVSSATRQSLSQPWCASKSHNHDASLREKPLRELSDDTEKTVKNHHTMQNIPGPNFTYFDMMWHRKAGTVHTSQRSINI